MVTLASSSTIDQRAVAYEAAARPYFDAVRDIGTFVNEQVVGVSSPGATSGLRDNLFRSMMQGKAYNDLTPNVRELVTEEEYRGAQALITRASETRTAFVDQYINIAELFGYGDDERGEGGKLRSNARADSPLYQIETRARSAALLDEGEALDSAYRVALQWSADRVDGANGQLHNTFRDAATVTAEEGYVSPVAAAATVAAETATALQSSGGAYIDALVAQRQAWLALPEQFQASGTGDAQLLEELREVANAVNATTGTLDIAGIRALPAFTALGENGAQVTDEYLQSLIASRDARAGYVAAVNGATAVDGQTRDAEAAAGSLYRAVSPATSEINNAHGEAARVALQASFDAGHVSATAVATTAPETATTGPEVAATTTETPAPATGRWSHNATVAAAADGQVQVAYGNTLGDIAGSQTELLAQLEEAGITGDSAKWALSMIIARKNDMGSVNDTIYAGRPVNLPTAEEVTAGIALLQATDGVASDSRVTWSEARDANIQTALPSLAAASAPERSS